MHVQDLKAIDRQSEFSYRACSFKPKSRDLLQTLTTYTFRTLFFSSVTWPLILRGPQVT